MRLRKASKTLLLLLTIFVLGYWIPEFFQMPVNGATIRSYAQNSFWAYPWGKSVTHKGVDIFARKGTQVHSSTPGIVVYTGQFSLGGNVVMVLGPKWQIHYYAHLDSIQASWLEPVSHHSRIGTVGTTGNAAGKPPHLHYSIRRLIPFPWKADKSVQGCKKMGYVNPIPLLNKGTAYSNSSTINDFPSTWRSTPRERLAPEITSRPEFLPAKPSW